MEVGSRRFATIRCESKATSSLSRFRLTPVTGQLNAMPKHNRHSTSYAVSAEAFEFHTRNTLKFVWDHARGGDSLAQASLSQLTDELELLRSSGADQAREQIELARAAASETLSFLPCVRRRGWTLEEIIQACAALFFTQQQLPVMRQDEFYTSGFGLAWLKSDAVEKEDHRQKPKESGEPQIDHEEKPQDIDRERRRIKVRVELLRSIESACESVVEHDDLRSWLVKEMFAECQLLVTTLLGKSTEQRDDMQYLLQICSSTKLGERLREVRKKKGLSQTQLAILARTHKQNVSEHEAGVHKPRLPAIEAYAAALRVPARRLIPRPGE